MIKSLFRQTPVLFRILFALCLGEILFFGTDLLTGCATTQPENVQLITEIAVSTGTSLWLKDHPEDRPKFENARLALKVIVDAGQGSPAQLSGALSRMPITVVTLPANSAGTVSVKAGTTKVMNARGSQVAQVTPTDVASDWVMPIARGAYYGLNSALGVK